MSAVCGNVLGERVVVPNDLLIPVEHQKTYIDRLLVNDGGWTKHKKGQTILHRPNAGYDIVYNFNGIEKRVTKVSEDMICGIIIN